MLKTGLALLAILALGTSIAHADPIILRGSTVTGSMTFGTSTTNAFSTSSSIINGSSGSEFDATDSTANYIVNFTNDSLKIKDNCIAAVRTCRNQLPFTMTFTDNAFSDAHFTLSSNEIGLTYSLSGDILTLNYAGGSPSQKKELTSFAVTAVTPEPSSIFLLGTGLLGSAGMVRRRLRA